MPTLIRSASTAGLNLTKQFEQCFLQAYLCPANKLTIGWGHVLQPMDYTLFNVPMARMGEIIKINQNAKRVVIPLRINQEQADKLLERDWAQVGLFLASVTQTPLTQHQFDALCSFIFNAGQGAYAISTLRKLVGQADFAGAAAEFDKWVYATVGDRKTKLAGLVTRRAAERKLFEGGV